MGYLHFYTVLILFFICTVIYSEVNARKGILLEIKGEMMLKIFVVVCGFCWSLVLVLCLCFWLSVWVFFVKPPQNLSTKISKILPTAEDHSL